MAQCERSHQDKCYSEAEYIVLSGCYSLHIHTRYFCAKHTNEYVGQVNQRYWYCGKCLSSGAAKTEGREAKLVREVIYEKL